MHPCVTFSAQRDQVPLFLSSPARLAAEFEVMHLQILHATADLAAPTIASSWKFRTTTTDLDRVWAKIPVGASVTVILEPTRNAWVPLSAWLQARGATVILVPPKQSADLRDYYNKHTKTDRLDSRVLARLPLLHPEGLRGIDNLGPAGSLRRAVRHRFSLVKRRTAASLRLDALVELLGPGWADSLGSATASKAALVVLEKYADPRALKRLGRARLAAFVDPLERGCGARTRPTSSWPWPTRPWRCGHAGASTSPSWPTTLLPKSEVLRRLDDEITAADKRIAVLYDEADPKGIVASAPGLGPVLSAAILANAGDFNRFANLAGVRSFTGFVPKIDQSGLVAGRKGITKAGDAGLRQALYMAADHARHIAPTLAQRYYRLVMVEGKHHNSALCSVSAVTITRIAACWRKRELYQLRDEDGEAINEAEGKAACTDRFKIDPKVRAAFSSQHPGQSPQEQGGGSGQKGVGPKGRSGHRPANEEPTENVA